MYILSCLKHLKVNIGLYRDDALGITCMTARQADLLKKEICRIFKEMKLSITIDVNMKVVNFLDITLDLNSGIYKPYIKPNYQPIYINKKSNHPPSIIKNIPAAVNRRLSNISANEDVFKGAIPPYQEALNKAGYEHQLSYQPKTNLGNSRRNRPRNITWFNPPFSRNVATNVGAKFLKTIDSCFPPSHPLAKIINRNTVKVSYRCMPNMGKVIAQHNMKVAKQNSAAQPIPPCCNCRGGPTNCPVEGACLTDGVVYQATVLREDTSIEEMYTGLTARTFKARYYEHRKDFNNQSREGTALSEYVWKLKNNNTPHKISWQILTRRQSFNPTKKMCNLCLTEKFYIMFHPEGATLNKRSEFYATCRHRLKPLLANT